MIFLYRNLFIAVITFSLLGTTTIAEAASRSGYSPAFQAAVNSASSAKENVATTTTTIVKETAFYYGKTNGGMPTWYGKKNMWEYPKKFTVIVEGCETTEVINNGHRWDTGLTVVKQSELGGRPMGIIVRNCPSSTVCHIIYDSSAPPVKK